MRESTNSRGKTTGVFLANELSALSMDDRTNALAAFQPRKVIYDVALAASKVELMHNDETTPAHFWQCIGQLQNLTTKTTVQHRATGTWKFGGQIGVWCLVKSTFRKVFHQIPYH